jgi:hypothetical protein
MDHPLGAALRNLDHRRDRVRRVEKARRIPVRNARNEGVSMAYTFDDKV